MSKSTITFKEFVKEPIKYANKISTKDLEKFLRKLSELYYNKESPITDKEFDELKDILEEKESDNPFLTEIGAPVEHSKVKLPYPMGSLNKVKPDSNELDKWIKKYSGPYELSDKMDGISALLYKENKGIDGMKLYTRGDGIFGQDITHLLKYIKIGTKIPKGVAIRGELIMSKKNFAKIANKMKNARNAVAGVVNSKTVDTKMAGMVDFITYNVIYPNFLQNEQYEYLEKWGCNVVPHKEVNKITLESLYEYFNERRNENDYEIDGIVVMDNEDIYKTEDGNPKYGFAFKAIMKDQYTIATVVDVEWSESRYKYIKPRVKIEPIQLVGVTITYATAHNAKFIYDNKIGVGSKIKIIRSGDVIPKIMEVISPAKNGKPKMPDVPYEWNETEVDIIATGDDDENNTTKIKQLVNTMKTLGVKYIDEGIMKKFVDNEYDSFVKILKADRTDIVEIIGDKMTEKIYNNIEKSLKNTELHILMSASNYFGRGVGSRKIHVITKAYPNIMKEKWDRDQMYENIVKLEGFQDKTTEKFVDGFEKFKKFFERVNKIIDINYLTEIKPEVVSKKKTNFGYKKVVITGFRNKDIQKFIEDNDGTVTGAVSKNTELVITVDDAEETAKLKEAKKIGIPIMTKTEFIKKFM